MPLALVVILLQGLVVFWVRGRGVFLSMTGLECTLVPLFVELVVAVVFLITFEKVRSEALANPHSLLGQSLRSSSDRAPEPPAARASWDGAWESPGSAAEKMRKGR